MRTKNLQNVVDTFDMSMMNMTIKEAHKHQICIDCKGSATKFDSECSAKEYEISGLCQHCQNEIFNGELL